MIDFFSFYEVSHTVLFIGVMYETISHFFAYDKSVAFFFL